MNSIPVRICRAIPPGFKVVFAWTGLAVMLFLRQEMLFDGVVTAWAETSAWVLLIIGFSLARGLEANFELLLRRMTTRGVLVVEEKNLEELRGRICHRAAVAELTAMLIIPIIMGLAYTVSYWGPLRNTSDDFVYKLILELAAVAFAGGYGGRIVAYGFLGSWLRRHDCEIRVTIGHPDGAGGLRVVGNFYLFQAGLVMLPVIFFAFWFVVGPVWRGSDFKEWQLTYGLAFLGMLVIEIAAFVLPMIFFHREMQRGTDRYFQEADDLGNEVMKMKAKLLQESDADVIESTRTQIEALEQKIQALENAPIWPVDAGIRKRFAWGNVLLFAIPFLAKSEISIDFIKESIEHFFVPT